MHLFAAAFLSVCDYPSFVNNSPTFILATKTKLLLQEENFL